LVREAVHLAHRERVAVQPRRDRAAALGAQIEREVVMLAHAGATIDRRATTFNHRARGARRAAGVTDNAATRPAPRARNREERRPGKRSTTAALACAPLFRLRMRPASPAARSLRLCGLCGLCGCFP